MNFNNYFRVATCFLQRQSLRGYAFKSDLKIKWVRPEKISCIKPEKSGDLSTLKPADPEAFLVHYENSDELKSADPAVQSLFQLKNNRNYCTSDMHKILLIKEVQRHSLDYGSMESKLAYMTATIRRNQEYMENFPRDKRRKVQLKEMIEKRKKFLKYLRRWDYPRFEWILEKLDLVFKPHPPEYKRVTRKESLQKLTDQYCEKVKQERLDAFKKKLQAEKIPTLEEKISSLELMRKEQIECDVPVTITEEVINQFKQELEKLKADRAENEKKEKQEKPQDEIL